MVYNKHEWQDGELITKDTLNNIEGGIFNLSSEQKYLDISVKTNYDATSQTLYWITKIPKKDKYGNFVELKRGFSNDEYGSRPLQTASQFNNIHKKAAFIMNGSPITNGNVIQNGIVLNSGDVLGKETLAIKKDGSVTSYPSGTNTNDMLADGAYNTIAGFFTLIKNGVKYNFEDVAKQDTSEGNTFEYLSQPHPRQLFGSDQNYYYAITIDGRKQRSIGFTLDDCVRVGLGLQLDFLYNMDGGGSTSTIVNGNRVNTVFDNGGKDERNANDFLYIEPEYYNGYFDENAYTHSLQTISAYTKTFYDLVDSLSADGLSNEQIPPTYIPLSSEFKTIGQKLQFRKTNGIVSIFGRFGSNVSDTTALFGESHPIAQNIDIGINTTTPVLFDGYIIYNGGTQQPIKLCYDGDKKIIYIYEPEDKVKTYTVSVFTTLPAVL